MCFKSKRWVHVLDTTAFEIKERSTPTSKRIIIARQFVEYSAV